MSAPLGQSLDELALALAKIKGVSVDDALRFLGGKAFANSAQWKMRGAMGGAQGVLKPGMAGRVARMAGSGPVYQALRVVPGLGVGMAALDAADIVTNNTSLGNKAMDAAAMGIGGAIGSIGGPLGVATGASLGKMTSDGIQYLFGDRKTPEQRKMEEALMMLQRGAY